MLATAIPAGFAQTIEPVTRVFDVRTWGVENGLPHITVTSIAQAHDEFLWIATYAGAARFDGASFRTYARETTPEITNDHFTYVFVDRRDRVFMASEAEMLVREGGYWHAYRAQQGWPGGRVWRIVEDKDGIVWAAVDDRLLRFDGATWADAPTPPIADGAAHFLIESDTGELFACSRTRLLRFDGATWSDVARPGELAGAQFSGVASARAGGLWIATATSIGRLVDGALVDVRARPAGFQDSDVVLVEDASGTLFVGSFEHGLMAWMRDGSILRAGRAEGLAHASITALLLDRDGQLLIGTSGGGLARLKRRRVSTFDESDGLGQNIVSMLAADGPNRLIVGTWGSGVTWLEHGRFEPPLVFEPLRLRAGSWICAAHRDRAGVLWVSPSEEGIVRVDHDAMTAPKIAGPAHATIKFIAEDGQGALWGASGAALLRISKDGVSRVPATEWPAPAAIESLGVDARGRLVVGTDGEGVWRDNGERIEKVRIPQLDHAHVRMTYRGESGECFVGLDDGRLARLDDDGAFVFGVEHGLPHAPIVGAIDDDRGALWLATAAGIVRVTHESLDAVRAGTRHDLEPTLLTQSDGMKRVDCRTSGEPRAARTDDGRLWFATVDGVAMVDPEHFARDPHEAETHIMSITADGERLDPRTDGGEMRVEVPAGARRIELRYASPNLSAPERVRFEYRMRADAEWIDAGSDRRVVLEEVEPREYDFEVRAVNPDGVRPSHWPRFVLEVRAFFWQTTWFRALLVLALVLCSGVTMFVIQNGRLTRQHERFEQARQLAQERERARRAVMALSETLQLVIDATPASIAYFDRASQYQWVNLAYAAWCGLPRAALLVTPVRDVLGPTRFAWIESRLRRALAGDGVREEESVLEPTTGEARHYEIQLIPDRGSDGAVAGVVHYIVDVSQRRHAEEERHELERKLQETARLESLGVLAGGIAHDFNNILTGVLGYASLARLDVVENTSVARSLVEIERSAQRAAELCRQLLAYSGRGRFDVQTVDLGAFVDDTTKLIRASIPKRVQVELRLGANVPAIQADVVQLRQIVMNLVINAAESIGAGPGLVRITSEVREISLIDLGSYRLAPPRGPGRYVALEVTDNGTGMTEATQGRIFEPFFTSKFAGRGLGLSAVLGIVRGHAGGIRVESAPGFGTTFTVLFEPQSGKVRPATKQPASVARVESGSGRILVVDDEPSVRAIAAAALQGVGFDVLEAEDGVAALAAFEAHADSIDLVLLDLEMPNMGGAETIPHLRARRPTVRILVMSGHSLTNVQTTALDAFLHKPFTVTTLREHVFALLRSGARSPSSGL